MNVLPILTKLLQMRIKQGNKGKARDNSLTPATKHQADGTFTAVKRYMHSFLYNSARKSTGKLKRVYFNGKKH